MVCVFRRENITAACSRSKYRPDSLVRGYRHRAVWVWWRGGCPKFIAGHTVANNPGLAQQPKLRQYWGSAQFARLGPCLER